MLSVGIILINLYCITTILKEKETRKLDYFLLVLQNVLDMAFSGLYSSAYCLLMVISYYQMICLSLQKDCAINDFETTVSRSKRKHSRLFLSLLKVDFNKCLSHIQSIRYSTWGQILFDPWTVIQLKFCWKHLTKPTVLPFYHFTERFAAKFTVWTSLLSVNILYSSGNSNKSKFGEYWHLKKVEKSWLQRTDVEKISSDSICLEKEEATV